MIVGYTYSLFRNHALSSGASVDPDAQAFITAAGITDPTQQSAVNQLVLDLKAASIWTKMKRIYPMLGGTATQHRVDLKTLATGTFFGGWTHSSTGSKSNGSTGYFDTGFSPSANLSQNDNSVGYYNRSLSPVNGYHGVGTPNWFIIGKYTGNEYFPNASSSILQSTTDFHKMIIGTRRSSTDVELYRNGVSVQTGSVTSQALPSNNFWLGGINNGGSIFLPSDMDLAFFFLGDGLSDTEASNLTTAVNTYQTTLGRNV